MLKYASDYLDSLSKLVLFEQTSVNLRYFDTFDISLNGKIYRDFMLFLHWMVLKSAGTYKSKFDNFESIGKI